MCFSSCAVMPSWGPALCLSGPPFNVCLSSPHISLESPHVSSDQYTHTMLCTHKVNSHIVTIKNRAQMGRNKASVCSYTNTLMRRSVGVETNSSFIMFTCRGDILVISITFTSLDQMTQPWHVHLCACVYEIVCVFDLTVVYLCGWVAIWSYRLFV